MRKLILIFSLFLPWCLKRLLLNRIKGFEISKNAHIGLSIINPKELVMKSGSSIGHFNIAIHLDKLELRENSKISRFNWITGFPTGTNSKHFSHDDGRKSELIVGKESAITKHHHIDCTNFIHIGDYVTIAGYYSQLLTHSIDVYQGRQDSHSIIIGDYCFVSTNVNILGGSLLPAHSILAAGAVLNKVYNDEWKIYGGVPAKPIKNISPTAKYFTRSEGFVF